MKTSFVWSFSQGIETSRSKNYADQALLSLDKTIFNPVILAKVTKNFLGKVNNSLFFTNHMSNTDSGILARTEPN